MERETEVELARRMITGEPEAFDRFVEYFRAKIFNYSWLMCGHREDAEEVAQETLLTVFESFDKLREPERVRPWMIPHRQKRLPHEAPQKYLCTGA